MSKHMIKENLVKWLDENNVSYEVNDAGQITVKGDLGVVFRNWVNNQGYTSLPNELTGVDGYLWLEYTQIENLGGLTSVGEYLDLYNTPITNLGNLTSVEGVLDLTGTPITNLGNLISVGGLLDLRGTPITSLGGLTSVEGGFDLRGTPITNLGGLTSVKTLYICDMKNSYFDLSPIESGKCKVDILALGKDTLHLLTQALIDKVSQVDFYNDEEREWRTLSTEEIREMVRQNEYNKAKESAVDTIDDSYMDDLREWGER